MDRYKKELCFGIVALVVVVVVLVIVWPHQSDLPGIEVHNVALEGANIVANLAGYLELQSNKSSHQTLDIHAVSRSIYNNIGKITLIGEKFQFILGYIIDQGGVPITNRYHFTSLDMLLKKDADGRTFEGICAFDEPFAFVLPDSQRYSCRQVLTHRCSQDGFPVAKLVLKSFELELDGDPDRVKKREFSKEGWPESCNKWDS